MITKLDLECPMRDGVLLRYDLYKPEDGARHPVILMRTPYGKNKIVYEKIYSNLEMFTGEGYCVAVMDLRGTGHSDGLFRVNTENEYEDGYDSVQQLAGEEWCDGNVGMFGLSYFGFTQLAAASMAPPALKAICPFMTLAMEPFGAHLYSHTVNDLHLNWIYSQLLEFPEHYLPDPAFREKTLPVLKEMNTRLQEYKDELPANRNRAALIGGIPMLEDYLALLNGIEEKSFWESIHHPTDFSKTHAGIFHCTGWFDVAKDTTIHNYNAISEEADEYTRQNSILLIGPWEHGSVLRHVQDGYDFGAENSGEGQQVDRLMLQWFDGYLKGKRGAADAMPRVRYFVMGENTWRTANVWPPENACMKEYYLGIGGKLKAEGPAADERYVAYDYDPMNPTPSFFTDSKGRGMIPDLGEWARGRTDMVCFETEKFTEALTVAGTIRARIYAETDVKDTDFVCRVADVYPDGTEFELATGLVRAKYRNGMWKRDFAPQGTTCCYDFEVGNTANTFLPGHRMKVYICSAFYPLYDRNLNTGAPACQGTEAVTAHQKIRMSPDCPSCILVPVTG